MRNNDKVSTEHFTSFEVGGRFNVPQLFQSFGVFSDVEGHEKFDREVNISSTVFRITFSIAGSLEGLPHGDRLGTPGAFPIIQSFQEIGWWLG